MHLGNIIVFPTCMTQLAQGPDVLLTDRKNKQTIADEIYLGQDIAPRVLWQGLMTVRFWGVVVWCYCLARAAAFQACAYLVPSNNSTSRTYLLCRHTRNTSRVHQGMKILEHGFRALAFAFLAYTSFWIAAYRGVWYDRAVFARKDSTFAFSRGDIDVSGARSLLPCSLAFSSHPCCIVECGDRSVVCTS